MTTSTPLPLRSSTPPLLHPSTPPPPRFDRAAWLTLAFVVLFCLVALGATFYVLRGPVDGWQIPYSVHDPPPLAYFAGDWPTPLLANDRVLAVAGTPVAIDSSTAPLPPPATWQEGGTVLYTVQRGDQQLDVPVTLHRFGPQGILRSLWHTAKDSPLDWTWALLAIVVFFLRPRVPAARLMFLAGVVFIVVTKLGWSATMIARDFTPAPVYYAYQLSVSFWGFLFFPSIILLALIFPRRIFPLSRWPRALPALLYGSGLALTVVFFATNTPAVLTAVLVAEAVLIVLAYGYALWHARTLRDDPVARAQTLWFAFGFAVSIAPLLIGYLLTYSGVVGNDAFLEFAGAVTTLALPICLAIAITRYHLFDIDLIINRTLVYVPLTAIVAGIFAAAISLSQKAFTTVTGQESLTSTLIATLIVVAVFNPLKDRVQRVVDRRFKEPPDPNRRLEAFREQLRTRVSKVDVEPIVRRFVDEAVVAFDAEGGSAYLAEPGNLREADDPPGADDPPVASAPPAAGDLPQADDPPAAGGLRRIYTTGEWSGEEHMTIPVQASGVRVACITLGARPRGRDYDEPDRQLLQQTAQAVADAIEQDGRLSRFQPAPARP